MLLKLVLKQLQYDRLMSICQVAVIASIIAPLLLLFSLRYGILEEMEQKLLNDPNTLSISLDTSYRLDNHFFTELAQHAEVGFLMPEITALNALANLKFPGGVSRITVIPTKVGDPIVLNSGFSYTTPDDALKDNELFVSESLAIARTLHVGDQVELFVSRTQGGKRMGARALFIVRGVVKDRFVNEEASVLVNLNVLHAIDDYRNGYEPEIFSDGSNKRATPRYYAKFRLYARSIDDVIPLYYFLIGQNLSVSSKVREIENVKSIYHVLNFVFGTIAFVTVLGGASVLAGINITLMRTRKRNLVLLRLMGQNSLDIYRMALLESTLIATTGFVLALLFYFMGSSIFNLYFQNMISGIVISTLTPLHYLLFYSCTMLLSILIAISVSKLVYLKVHISEILREV